MKKIINKFKGLKRWQQILLVLFVLGLLIPTPETETEEIEYAPEITEEETYNIEEEIELTNLELAEKFIEEFVDGLREPIEIRNISFGTHYSAFEDAEFDENGDIITDMHLANIRLEFTSRSATGAESMIEHVSNNLAVALAAEEFGISSIRIFMAAPHLSNDNVARSTWNRAETDTSRVILDEMLWFEPLNQ